MGEVVSGRDFDGRILPALREAAAVDDGWCGIGPAALLGLARTGDEASMGLFRATARNGEAEPHSKVMEECGVLALGWVEGGPPGNAALLQAIIQDPKAGTRSRSFAFVALARIEKGAPSPATLDLLEAALFSRGDGRPFWPDNSVSAAFALGSLNSPAAAGILRRFLDSPPLPDQSGRAVNSRLRWPPLRAHAAASLGRAAGGSGDKGTAEEAFGTLESISRADESLGVQGAVLGLGFLGAGGSPEVSTKCVGVLQSLFESESTESQARRFAALALARIAASGPSGSRDEAMEVLHRALATARPTPSWAALAAGIAGEGRSESERTALAIGVRALWQAPLPEGARVVEDRGGCLVALGLLRDSSAEPLLVEILTNGGEDSDLRGYAATGLGLLAGPSTVSSLRAVLEDKSERRWRRTVVVALGLLGDSESVPAILDVMRNPKSSQFVLGGCVQALGFLKDGGATEPLLEIAADEKYPDLTRAMAIQALSRMAAGARPDPFAELTEGVPYRACTDALIELWSIL